MVANFDTGANDAPKDPHASHQARQRARTRAYSRVVAEYPDLFRLLLNEERAKEGLPPVGVLPIGRRPRTEPR